MNTVYCATLNGCNHSYQTYADISISCVTTVDASALSTHIGASVTQASGSSTTPSVSVRRLLWLTCAAPRYAFESWHDRLWTTLFNRPFATNELSEGTLRDSEMNTFVSVICVRGHQSTSILSDHINCVNDSRRYGHRVIASNGMKKCDEWKPFQLHHIVIACGIQNVLLKISPEFLAVLHKNTVAGPLSKVSHQLD